MGKGFLGQHKRTLAFLSILLGLFVGVIIFSIVRSEVTYSGNEEAFALSEKSLRVVSCSLDGLAGVSQGEALEIRYNQIVSLNAAGDIEISPAIKGDWQAVDDRLIFTPAGRWEAGTYYTVYIGNNSPIRDMDKTLEKPAAFSFETQDSALRIPAKATFEVDKRQYFFANNQEVVLQAGYTDSGGNVNAAVGVKVWQFPSNDSFVKAFTPLFSLPEWAHISRSKFTADTSGLEYLGKKDMPLVDGKIQYGALAPGQYLFRLVVGGAACDVAVTIDDISVYQVFDGEDIYLWAHNDDEPLSGAKLRVGDDVTAFDKNGCAKIAYNYSPASQLTDPSVWALQIVDANINHVVFLEQTSLTPPSYSGEIAVDKTTVTKGEDLFFSGVLRKPYNLSQEFDSAIVTLSGDSGKIMRNRVDIEANGAFSGTLRELMLPVGNYRLSISVGGQEVACAGFSVANQGVNGSGRLLVNATTTQASPGETLAFQVKAVFADGSPIAGLKIDSSIGTSQGLTDEKGETTVYITAEDTMGLPSLGKTATLTAVLGRERLAASISYNVVADEKAVADETEGQIASPSVNTTDEVGDSQSAISFVPRNGDFVIEMGEASNPSFTVAFTGERYIMTTPRDNTPLALNTEEEYTVNSGENLEVTASASGENTVILAELYEGIIPGALLGRDFTQASDIMAESRPLAAFINSQGYFVFNTKGLSGNYYLRLQAQAENGSALCRYLPVSIMNGGQLVTGLADFYRQGEAISLNLALSGGADLAYEVLLDDVQVDAGAAEHDVIVNLGAPELGRHICKVNLSRSGLTVASQVLEFAVYSSEPSFMAVSDEPTDSAAEIYAVPSSEAAYFQKLFAYNLFPGNQLLQVMGRQEFYSSLGDNSSLLATYINNDLSSYQNADGSFSRLPGAKGDMLLSALVADFGGVDGVQYDKGALESFFRNKMALDNDPEILALAYWGLSLLDKAPVENMVYHIGDSSFSDRAKLYLAEAFYAAGITENAVEIYNSLAKDLRTVGSSTFFHKEDEPDSVLRTLFMLDLSMKLGKDDTAGLLYYLMSAEMSTQTNRYMLSRCLLNYVDLAAVELADDEVSSDKQRLSIEPWLPDTEGTIKGAFALKGEETTTAKVGDILSLSASWPEYAEDNALYMLYSTAANVSFLKQDNLIADHGHGIYLTMDTAAEIYLRVTESGKQVLGDLYVFNLTEGKVIGKIDVEDLVVVE